MYQSPQSELLRDGRNLGKIEGSILEAQYAVDTNTYILLITDNVPYEETLRAYLVNGNGLT